MITFPLSTSKYSRVIGKKEEVLSCPACDWQGTWSGYQATYRRAQLIAGSMEPFFRAFLEQYPKARTLGHKMVLIDTLLHHYHGELLEAPCRPGALNLIEGRMDDIVAFLDALSRGPESTPGVLDRAAQWKQLEAASRARMGRDPQ